MSQHYPNDHKTTSVVEGDRIRRFSLKMRIQHIILMALLIILSLTGFTLLLSGEWLGDVLVRLEGGFEVRGWIHRFCAVSLILVGLYHFYWITMTEEGHRELMLLKFNRQDFRDFVGLMRYNIGRTDVGPMFHKYGFGEKFQYWGLMVGVIFIAFTGFPLWARNEMMAILPRWVLILIRIIHGSEGLLIFLVLFVWHMYNVHLRPGNFPWNSSFITGYISKEKLKEEHELEYNELCEGGRNYEL